MSSGNHASPAGWNHSEKPNSGAECEHLPERTGPDVRWAGLCCNRGCGRATVHRGADGLPRHMRIIPAEGE